MQITCSTKIVLGIRELCLVEFRLLQNLIEFYEKKNDYIDGAWMIQKIVFYTNNLPPHHENTKITFLLMLRCITIYISLVLGKILFNQMVQRYSRRIEKSSLMKYLASVVEIWWENCAVTDGQTDRQSHLISINFYPSLVERGIRKACFTEIHCFFFFFNGNLEIKNESEFLTKKINDHMFILLK